MVIITDTGSDILNEEAKELGIRLVSLQSSFSDLCFSQNTKESFRQFYTELEQREELPVSSQPAPTQFVSEYEKAMENGEDVIVITISSKLSGTYNCALLAKDIAEYENIYVVDSMQASLSQRMLVMCAVKLRDAGLSAKEVADKLTVHRNKITIYGVPETLLYLKKGGRISAISAGIGDALKLKPVLTVVDGVIECKTKVRGEKAARREMLKSLKEMDIDPEMPILFAHSNNPEKGIELQEAIMENYPGVDSCLYEIGPVIGTHVGPNALMVVAIER